MCNREGGNIFFSQTLQDTFNTLQSIALANTDLMISPTKREKCASQPGKSKFCVVCMI